MKKLLSGMLTLALVAPYCLPAQAAPADSQQSFQPNVTYEVSVTDDERAIIHDEVDKISGDVGDMKVGDGTYDPYSLIGGLATGSDYDSISYGSKAAGSVPSEYPFAVPDTEANNNEHSRKVEKLAWVKELAEELGFPVVVQRQEDKYVYIEIGDPDAPEMVMALSHLDSPTASNNEAQLERWVNAEGETGDPTSYHTPYVKDGWLYGAGVQDDSGPTLATLFAAKALMEAGLPMDRRIRIVMGCYEDSNPGVPTKEDTLKYMDIPYYTSNPSFYDNWCYKSLNREEMPIAAYTSDSRFPVVVGNSKAITPTISMDLTADSGKTFSLISAGANVTLREGDETLKDIVYGSTSQVASRAVFTLKADSVEENNQAFVNAVTEAATKLGWLPAAEGTTPKVSVEVKDGTIVLETNTDVAMEMPTPQYGKNAVVWGMYLISQGLGDSSELQLKKAADGISDLFFQNCVEGEAYIGSYMGIPQDLLRNPDSGVANLTFALMGGIQGTEELKSFFSDNSLSIPLYIRSMHANEEDYTTAMDATVQAFHDKGFTWQVSRMEEGQYTAYSNPTLYASHDNPLIALQYASYKATMESDPEAFADVSDLLDITYPVGTTGGTLASNYLNKMTAFGAVIPGNERWWHSANERIGVDAIIEMTKLMADGMLEMARYSGPAGAQLMWADIDGLNADRADLDLLDVTIGTYQDASEAVTNSEDMLAATKFDIPMWAERGNSSKTDAQFKSGEVYLSTDDEDFQANTFVLPMRLEFKVEKPESMSQTDWNALAASGFAGFTFHIQKDGQDIPLTVPEGQDASKYFAARVSSSDPDIIYASVNLAITDAAYDGVSTVLADSKTDLYDLNDEWLESNEDPFPERGAVEERGFFLFGDGEKNARFTSPEAIYVTADDTVEVEPGTLTFTYPENIDPEETSLELYKGFPTSSSQTLDTMISKGYLTEIKSDTEGVYTITEPGVYSYHISGDGYYNILKIINITAEDIANDMEVEVVGGPLGANDDPFGDGYQPTVKPSQAPDTYVMDSRDAMLCIWPDEILKNFTVEDQGYQTPAFDGTDAAHEFTTQGELMAFLQDRDEKCDYMHLYSAGTTPNYNFDIPLAIFTNSDIPEDATLEEAAQLVRDNGKTTVWYQTQIHPNEPASGEAALVIIDKFINEPETKALLDDINVVIVPRINPDGSYLFSRATYDGFDMNRDHMSLKAAELAQLHTAYRLFMAEVVLDGHEFTFYGASTDKSSGKAYMSNAYDVETTPATSLNNNAAVTDIALDMCGDAFDDARDEGLRIYHYGTTVNNPIGRAYFGLYDCVSFLIETRGIGAGKTNFERRVFSQETVIMSYITGTAERAEEIKETVAAARAETIANGKTYDEDDLLYLHQIKSGETLTEYYGLDTQYYFDGQLKRENPQYLSLNDTGARTRVRPTAYVIPADVKNIDKILYIMDNQGAEYYTISPSTKVELQQYYFVEADGNSCVADLRDAAEVSFPGGAYVFPMDQVAADVIAMLVEPDVTDSKGYDGTLYQYGAIDYDETTLNFPIYRYITDNPRETLPEGSLPSSGGSSSGGSSTTITTTTDGNGTVIKVVTDKTTGTITTTMEYKNGVTVKAVENSVGVVTVNVTVPSSVDSATVTIPVKNPTTSTVAKLSKSGQVIRTGVAGKDGITLTLTESTSLTILDNAKTFSDVASGQWYAEAVNFVTSHEIFAGVGNGTFAPNSTMTRAMLWTVLYGLEGQQSAAAGQTWYSNAQDWAMKNGVSDGTNPNGSITREQIAVTLYGYAKAQGIAGTVTGDLSKFQDASSVSSWATEAMAWAVQNGLISGKDNGSLAPQDTATRAELAQIMMQFVTTSVK